MGHSLFQGLEPQRFISKMIALILALALVAPSMSAPQFLRFANPTSVLGRTYATTRNAAPAVSTPDLTALYANFEASKPLVEQAEALSNGVFPNDGRPIVVGNQIRTQFGNAPLPSGNVLDPNVRAELSDALSAVVDGPKLDPIALNKVLELSRDLSLSSDPVTMCWVSMATLSTFVPPSIGAPEVQA